MKKPTILTIILFTIQFLAPIFAQTEQKPQLYIQTGHSSSVNSVDFSPDGNILASGSGDKTIRLWSGKTGRELKSLNAHTDGIGEVAFSPDGKKLASGSSDRTVKLWDLQLGKLLLSIEDNETSISSISFSPNGKILAFGSTSKISFAPWENQEGKIKLWDVETGHLIRVLESRSYLLNSVLFSPDAIVFSPNSKIIVSGGDNKIRFWDVQTGQLLKSLDSYSDSIAFSPDGNILASSHYNSDIKLWDVETGQLLKSLDKSSSYSNIIFSSDGKFLVSGSSKDDKTIKLWDVETGQLLKFFRGHQALVRTLKFTHDNKILASGSDDQTIKLWDVKTGELLNTLKSRNQVVNSIAFSSDSRIIASGTNDPSIKLWDLQLGRQLKSLEGHTANINVVTFSSNNQLLLSGASSFHNTLSLTEQLSTIEASGESSFDNAIKIWNVENGQLVENLKGHKFSVHSIAFFPPRNIMASASDSIYDKTIKIWDAKNGQHLKSLEGHTDSVKAIAFSPDGKILVSGSSDKTIKLWDVETGQLTKSLDVITSEVTSVVFSPDGKKIASGGYDNIIRIWSAETGKLTKSLENYTAYTVTFSPDGRTLASGGYDKILRIWSVETGKLVKSLEGHTDSIRVIAFSPDGKTIASGSRDTTIKLWNVRKSEILATLTSLDKDDWIISTTNGRFDTNKLENPEGLHWIMPDAPFTPLSFEVFMRDYYEPNLLPRLLKCTEENNCEQEFKPVRNLTELNRTQPTVKIADIKPTDAADVVRVTVEAEDAVSEYQKDKQNKPLRSGVQDLRLFRDGQLVGYAPDGDGAVGVDGRGKYTKTFAVRLPKNRDLKEVNFTAYAFNFDRVKSETAQKNYVLPQKLAAAKGSAVIVTIGVNANETASYNLRYAANDARRLQSELVKNLPPDRYEKIVQIPLVSDFDDAGKLSENNATKAKIKAVLDRLAGKTAAGDLLKNVPNKDLLKKVQPEDLVLIAFSGHGYADREGVFYLIPYDIGKSAGGGLKNVLDKSVSSDELSLWLRDVDAGEMLMIVDACHSAAAVQGKDFKPGPMGSRGLGQLSYDKGMRILTATQADNVALELGNLQHGLLTYSLVKNGIELGLADYQPQDNKLFSSEWLGFAVKDVPVLYEKAAKGNLKNLFVDGKPKSDVIFLGNQKSNLNLQQPSLFDFSRRDRQYELVNLLLKNVTASK